ncbi:uncharacterized protein EV420DRAFT_1478404 [Desarmillaria tabescens]|uniref:Uncharacterized protein n=1 Tax=Armillaria tabescens TaxID=1929756 RepID=A0AA39T2V9_ARMTA|nr:uncharacterized protein EV420DRAFT_1478404 [Desarmillaria tabescens]KAK0460646.1 hypothetical protein EV420DRAFT_1478404 [Desarmillaria tabescens]
MAWWWKGMRAIDGRGRLKVVVIDLAKWAAASTAVYDQVLPQHWVDDSITDVSVNSGRAYGDDRIGRENKHRIHDPPFKEWEMHEFEVGPDVRRGAVGNSGPHSGHTARILGAFLQGAQWLSSSSAVGIPTFLLLSRSIPPALSRPHTPSTVPHSPALLSCMALHRFRALLLGGSEWGALIHIHCHDSFNLAQNRVIIAFKPLHITFAQRVSLTILLEILGSGIFLSAIRNVGPRPVLWSLLAAAVAPEVQLGNTRLIGRVFGSQSTTHNEAQRILGFPVYRVQVVPDASDNPSLGSPYGIGKETFGLPSGFKRAFVMDVCQFPVDQRYSFIHGALSSPTELESSILLSEMMIGYWISFATNLDPNDSDGLGGSPIVRSFLTKVHVRELGLGYTLDSRLGVMLPGLDEKVFIISLLMEKRTALGSLQLDICNQHYSPGQDKEYTCACGKQVVDAAGTPSLRVHST